MCVVGKTFRICGFGEGAVLAWSEGTGATRAVLAWSEGIGATRGSVGVIGSYCGDKGQCWRDWKVLGRQRAVLAWSEVTGATRAVLAWLEVTGATRGSVGVIGRYWGDKGSVGVIGRYWGDKGQCWRDRKILGRQYRILDLDTFFYFVFSSWEVRSMGEITTCLFFMFMVPCIIIYSMK